MRQVHLPDLACTRPGERSSFVPEEFVLHQPFRDGRAIQRHKRLLPPRRQVVNRQGEQLFSRPAFSQQQASRIRRRHFLNLLAHFSDGRMFAYDSRKSIARGVFLAQQQIFPQELLLTRRPLH